MAARANALGNLSRNASNHTYKNSKTNFYDIMQPDLLKKSIKTTAAITKKIKSFISMFPNDIFNFLLNQNPYKLIIKNYEQIYNYDANISEYLTQNDKFTIKICLPDTDNKAFEDEFMIFLGSPDKRFFFGIVKLGYPSGIYEKIGFIKHMTSLIIDKEKERIIFFDPKGKIGSVSPYCPFNLEEFLKNIIEKKFDYEFYKNIYKFTHLSGSDEAFITPQYFDTNCQTYALYFGLLYLMNPDIENVDVYKLITTMTPAKCEKFQYMLYNNYFNNESNRNIFFDYFNQKTNVQNAISISSYNSQENSSNIDNKPRAAATGKAKAKAKVTVTKPTVKARATATAKATANRNSVSTNNVISLEKFEYPTAAKPHTPVLPAANISASNHESRNTDNNSNNNANPIQNLHNFKYPINEQTTYPKHKKHSRKHTKKTGYPKH